MLIKQAKGTILLGLGAGRISEVGRLGQLRYRCFAAALIRNLRWEHGPCLDPMTAQTWFAHATLFAGRKRIFLMFTVNYAKGLAEGDQ